MTAEIALGAIALCPIVISITRSLRKGYKSVKYARRELEELTNDMDVFTDLYSEFLKACSTRQKHRKRIFSTKKKLVAWTERAIRDFKELLYKVDALSRDPIYQHTIMETAFAHCKWYFSKSHLGYLRASLGVARQSMVGFTNICNIELLDEQLAHLKSVMTPQQRREIEKEYNMTVEQRIEELQGIRNTCELQQSELPRRIKEASDKVKFYQKQTKDDEVVEHTRQILTFSRSVNRYGDYVLPMDKAGNRPPRPSWRSSDGSQRLRHDSSFTSHSTATTQTRSTQPSDHHTSAPESPLTSPGLIFEDLPDPTQADEEESTSILNFCSTCGGTCTNTEAHNTSIQNPPLDPAPHTVPDAAIVTPAPSFEHAPNTIRPKPSSFPQIPPIRRMQPSSSKQIPPSNPRCTACRHHQVETSIQSDTGAGANSHIHSVNEESHEEISEDAETGEELSTNGEELSTNGEDLSTNGEDLSTNGEDLSTNGQATGSGASIWKATSGFEGDMPKGLRIRRWRSPSPRYP